MGPSLTALALLLLSQGPVREKPADRLHVEWISPEGCPERSSLREALVASVPPQRAFSAVVRVDEPRTADARWRAVIITRVDDLQRLRVIEGANCSQVTEAAVLVVTIAALELRQDDDARTAPVELPPRSQSDEVPPEAAAQEDKQPGPPDEPFPIPLQLQPMLGANVGLFPVPGVSVGLAVATRLGPFWLQLGASSWLENESAGPRKVHLALQSFSLRAAWLGRLGTRLELGPSLVGELGPLTATGVGVALPSTVTTWWAATLAGIQSGYAVTRSLRLSASLELGLNLARPRFVLADSFEVHRVGWVLGRLSVGLEVDLL